MVVHKNGPHVRQKDPVVLFCAFLGPGTADVLAISIPDRSSFQTSTHEGSKIYRFPRSTFYTKNGPVLNTHP